MVAGSAPALNVRDVALSIGACALVRGALGTIDRPS